MKLGGGKEWFTAAELAALALPGMPTTKRKINERAATDLWAQRLGQDGEPLTRRREGRGGGVEYHYSVLPSAARSAIAAKRVAIVADISPRPETSIAAAWRDYDAMNAKAKAEAQRRAETVAMVDAYERAGLTRSAAVANAAARAKVGQSTLWTWLQLVEGIAPSNRLPLLAPRRIGGGATAEIDPAAWQYLLSDYLRPERPSFSTCFRRLQVFAAANGLTLPGDRTLRRKLEQVDRRLVIARRDGAEALRQTLPPQRRSIADLHAMALVNIDGHKWDVFCRWPDGRIGRPMMVAIQDVYSRKFLAWRIDESESALSTRLVFADLFKTWGIPTACLMDNGRAFASKLITGGAKSRYRFKIREEEPTGLLTALGIAIHWATPYRGQSKPIERGFRDFCDAIAKDPELAGAYTGNTPLAKPENYASRAIPIADFAAIVDAGIAEHNARSGRDTEAAAGRSFDVAFEESYAAMPIGRASPEQLRLALLAAEDRHCNSKTAELEIEGNRYWSEALAPHAGEKLTVRFDPDDLHGEVHAYTRDGAFIATVPCLMPVGFMDKAAAGGRRKQEADLRRLARELAEKEQLLRADQLADLTPRHSAPAPIDPPSVVRPVRYRGQAVARKLSPQIAERAAQEAEQAALIDQMAAGMRRHRLRIVD